MSTWTETILWMVLSIAGAVLNLGMLSLPTHWSCKVLNIIAVILSVGATISYYRRAKRMEASHRIDIEIRITDKENDTHS